ncbi:MAG: ABC transporter ATP-binding protein [Bacteroidota bacterium]
MTVPALRALELTFAYSRERPVLDRLNFAVPAGCVTGLLGANGSGKSTLLRLFAGTLHPCAGRIELCGADLRRLSRRAIARRLAVVPQGDPGISSFTVRELVAMGRYPWQTWYAPSSSVDDAAVDEALSSVGLTALASRRAEYLSGGERQLVQVAMALAQRPEILLLDEPTTYLDIRHQIELLDLVSAECRRRGRTVVMILHDLNLAALYADRLALLHAGRVLAGGAPAEVLTPSNLARAFGIEADVVHGAYGRPHVILRPGRLNARRDGPRVHVIGGGGTAANLLGVLSGLGYRISLGVANQGDLDAILAREHGVETVLVPPGRPVDEEASARCRALVEKASALIVANAPFGPGNLPNLRLALEARRCGLPVILVAEDPIAMRDFTGGEATAIYRQLCAAGAEEMPHEQVVPARLREVLGGAPGV